MKAKTSIILASVLNAALAACAATTGLLILTLDYERTFIAATVARIRSIPLLSVLQHATCCLIYTCVFVATLTRARAHSLTLRMSLPLLLCSQAFVWYYCAVWTAAFRYVWDAHGALVEETAMRTALFCLGLGASAVVGNRHDHRGMCATVACALCATALVSTAVDVALLLDDAPNTAQPALFRISVPLRKTWSALVHLRPQAACALQDHWSCRGFLDGDCKSDGRICEFSLMCPDAKRCPVCSAFGKCPTQKLEAIADHSQNFGEKNRRFESNDEEWDDADEEGGHTFGQYKRFEEHSQIDDGCFRRFVQKIWYHRMLVKVVCYAVAFCIAAHVALVMFLPISTFELFAILLKERKRLVPSD